MFDIMYAAIFADIVFSTSLSKDAMIELTEKLRGILCLLEDRYEGLWDRSIKSEFVLTGTLFSLTIALCLGLVAVKWNI